MENAIKKLLRELYEGLDLEEENKKKKNINIDLRKHESEPTTGDI